MPLILQSNDTHSQFSIQKGDKEIAAFKYNSQSLSVRIHSAQKRVFFLKPAGFLQNRIILATEYGVEIGENHARNRSKGMVQLGDNKFHYTVAASHITIRDKRKQPLANLTFRNPQPADSYTVAAILFSIAWLLDSGELKLEKISAEATHTA
ncbi:MAG TPA: hypothetical protein VD996_04115 [Chitinophagaceae bacterium]|nr:hypothetical protein [Chitinophagaceae bacterium]